MLLIAQSLQPEPADRRVAAAALNKGAPFEPLNKAPPRPQKLKKQQNVKQTWLFTMFCFIFS